MPKEKTLAKQIERWKTHFMEIFDVSTHTQEIVVEKDIINQLHEHLTQTQTQIED